MKNQPNNEESNNIPWKLLGQIFLVIVAVVLIIIFGWQVKSISILGFELEPPATPTPKTISTAIPISITEFVALEQAPDVSTTPETIVANLASEFYPKAKVIYKTNFDNIMNWGQDGTVDLIDNHLVVGGKSSGASHTTAIRTGDGFLVLFKCSSGTSANIVLFNALTNGSKYVGIQIPTSGEFTVSLGYGDTWAGGAQLNGNLSFTTDHWYYALIEIRDRGQFYLKVWDKDNSNLYNEKTLPLGTDWENSSWYGSITTNQYNNGQIEAAYYEEFSIGSK